MVEREDKTDWLDQFRTAAVFLTAIPLGKGESRLSDSVVWFPVVGAITGLAGGLAFATIVAIGLGAWVAAVVAVAVMIVMTGALHEDGLADTFDGFGCQGEIGVRLAAMRDPAVGTCGTLALVIVTSLRIGLIATITEPLMAIPVLVAAGAISRGSIVAAMHLMMAARPDGLGAAAGTPDFPNVVKSFGVVLVIAIAALWPFSWFLAISAGVVATLVMIWLCTRSFGGHTGDVFGGIQQVSESAVLAVAVASL